MNRRSRFQRTPSDAKRRLTRLDFSILELLNSYRYLPSDYLVEFIRRAGKGASYVPKRLTLLRHDLGVIDCPPASWHAANARYRPAVYMLTRKGDDALRSRGIAPARKSGNEFCHELMISLFHASVALGVSDDAKLSLITTEDIVAHPSCPKATRVLSDPFAIPVSFSYLAPKSGTRSHIEQTIRHDGEPFGLAYTANGATVRLFFPGIEADRRTEPLSAERSGRTSIRKKLCAIREVARHRLYEKHLGIPNYLVPIITTSEVHKRSMMTLVDELSGGKGSRMLLFKSMADFSAFERFPKPSGHFLTEPWERVGHPTFDIVEELKKAATEPRI